MEKTSKAAPKGETTTARRAPMRAATSATGLMARIREEAFVRVDLAIADTIGAVRALERFAIPKGRIHRALHDLEGMQARLGREAERQARKTAPDGARGRATPAKI